MTDDGHVRGIVSKVVNHHLFWYLNKISVLLMCLFLMLVCMARIDHRVLCFTVAWFVLCYAALACEIRLK